jgi:hypothetical protein
LGFTGASGTTVYTNNSPCSLVLGPGYAYCTIGGIYVSGPAGTVTLIGTYGGDSTHAKSSATFNLSVVNPPSTVTVSGTATTKGFGTTAAQL